MYMGFFGLAIALVDLLYLLFNRFFFIALIATFKVMAETRMNRGFQNDTSLIIIYI